MVTVYGTSTKITTFILLMVVLAIFTAMLDFISNQFKMEKLVTDKKVV